LVAVGTGFTVIMADPLITALLALQQQNRNFTELTPKNFLLIIFNVVYIEVMKQERNYEQISNKFLRTFY
jgi:hypothetical protein